MPVKKPAFITEPYSGYYHSEVPEDDKELTRVGPGTPAGEYLRRFWQPVLVAQQVLLWAISSASSGSPLHILIS